MLGDESVDCEADSLRPESGGDRRIAGWIMAAYLIVLCVFGAVNSHGGSADEVPAFALRDLLQPADLIAGFALDGSIEVAKFLVLGLLVSLALGRSPDPDSLRTSLLRKASFLLTGAGLSFVVCSLESGRPAHPLLLVLPLAGFLLGVWIGSAWLGGYRAVLRLAGKFCLLLALLAAGLAGLVLLALDSVPLGFDTPNVTANEKRRIVEVLRNSAEVGKETRRLGLAQRDVNSILALAMAQSPLDGKATVAIERGGFAAKLSLRTPFRLPALRYLNLQGTFDMEVTGGHLQLSSRQLRIGRLPIPGMIQDFCVPPVVSALLADPDIGQTVATIDSLRLTPKVGKLVYQTGNHRRGNISSLLNRLSQNPDALLETGIYLRHLVSVAGELPEGETRFAAFVQSAFKLAEERSVDRDPSLENRGAILALAILLGHRHVETLVGPVVDDDVRRTVHLSTGKITLRGRRDWPRHFFVSAALALLSNEDLSDDMGVFKEEVDSGEGGSGFSFADLLADLAGTKFAMAATRDAGSARKMQERLSGEFSVDDICPDAAGLPEGISDAQLQSQYGGVGGAGYGGVVAEIERRLSTCSALRPR